MLVTLRVNFGSIVINASIGKRNKIGDRLDLFALQISGSVLKLNRGNGRICIMSGYLLLHTGKKGIHLLRAAVLKQSQELVAAVAANEAQIDGRCL